MGKGTHTQTKRESGRNAHKYIKEKLILKNHTAAATAVNRMSKDINLEQSSLAECLKTQR